MPEYPLWDLATQRPELGHYVYRIYDADGVLLYVGSTGNVWYRIGQHAAERSWWPEVAWDRTIVECISETVCPGRPCRLAEHAEMLSYETRLIKDLHPRHNTLLNGYCRSGRHLRADHGKPDGKGGWKCGACNSERYRRYYEANRESRPEVRARRRAQYVTRKAATAAGQLTLED